MSQQAILFDFKLDTDLLSKDNFAYEGCPKRKCHKSALLTELITEGIETDFCEEAATLDDEGIETGTLGLSCRR